MAVTITLHPGYIFTDNEAITVAKLNMLFSLGFGTQDSGTIGTSIIEDKAITLEKMADLARGSIYTGQASNRPAALDAKTDAYILIGDGTDLNSVAVSGHISIANDGTVTFIGDVQTSIGSTPSRKGQLAVVSSQLYYAKDTTAASDWIELNDAETSVASAPVRIGQIAVVSNDFYYAKGVAGADDWRKCKPNMSSYYKHNLVVKNNYAVPNTMIDIDCDEITLTHDTDDYNDVFNSINVTIDTAGTGANGMDSGTLASGTMYYIWLISNGATKAGLISLSNSAPTLPSGYVFKRLVGEVWSDGSTHFTKFLRENDEVWFEDPQAVYTSQLLSAYAEFSLPDTVPLGCKKLKFEAGTEATGYPAACVVKPSSDDKFEIAVFNEDSASALVTNKGPSGYYNPIQFDMKHLGADSVYVRDNGETTGAGYQGLWVWGYDLAR